MDSLMPHFKSTFLTNPTKRNCIASTSVIEKPIAITRSILKQEELGPLVPEDVKYELRMLLIVQLIKLLRLMRVKTVRRFLLSPFLHQVRQRLPPPTILMMLLTPTFPEEAFLPCKAKVEHHALHMVQGDRDLRGQFTTIQRIKVCHTSNLPTKLVCSLLIVNTFLDIPNIQLDEMRFLKDSINTLLPPRQLELIRTNTHPPPSTQLTPTVRMFQDSLNTLLSHSILPPPSIKLKKS